MFKFLITAFFISFTSLVFAKDIKCENWQIYVKKHLVKAYIKSDGTKIKKSIRKAHCRERWNNADIWGPTFKNQRPVYWPNKNEIFKKWTNLEKELVLKLLSEIPSIEHYKLDKLLRAVKSKDKNNPASTIEVKQDIVLYNLFFKAINKKEILLHEFAHIIFYKLSEKEKYKFAKLSGWRIVKIKGRWAEVGFCS
ncbi:MAG: hypothetical protein HOE90_12145 [Bacteriovoracaceae bacterium]|jgi:hypothetical protein|nr:hypothetical protein [Bacteriovoracaceae bacterium]